MSKVLKITTYSLLSLLLIALLGLFALTTLVDPNTFKPYLVEEVKTLTGRDVSIDGNLSWRLYPWINLSARQIKIAERGGFKNRPPFAAADQLHFSLEFLPLLRGKINIGEIRIKQLRMRLRIDRQNQNNWQDIITQVNQSQARTTSTSDASKKSSSFFDLDTLNIDSINVQHATISFNNQATGKKVVLDDLNYKGDFSLSKTLHTSATVETQIPMLLLRRINAKGKLSLAKLSVDQLNITHVETTFHAKKGRLTASPVIAKVYQGVSNAKAMLDVSGFAPRFTAQETLSKVQAAGLFKDLGYRNQITGTFNSDISLRSDNVTLFPKNLQGKANIRFDNGVIHGVSLFNTLRKAARLARLDAGEASPSEQTTFVALTGSATIKNGIAQNDDLQLKAQDVQVKGQGELNFVTRQIDYRIQTQLPEKADKNLLKLQTMLGGSIPLLVTGSLSDYQISPDTRTILQAAAKFFIQKESKKLEMH